MLSDVELRRKDPSTNDYTDLCTTCFIWSIDNYVQNGGHISDVNTLQLLEEIGVSSEETYEIISGIRSKMSDEKDNY